METISINKYLKSETPFIDADISILEEIVEENPWFSLGNQLLLKAYKQTKDDRYYYILSKVALQTYNRKHLHQYLQKKAQDNLTDEVEERIESAEKDTTYSQNQDENLFSFSNEYFSLEDISIEKDENFVPDETNDELISKFIVASPKIIPRPIDAALSVEFGLEDGSPHLVEDIVSESLADVYISQGLYSMAKECYEKLSLLNPEKSAYFAKLIEGIKNKK